jgi:Protein of unknown function (DUF3313)
MGRKISALIVLSGLAMIFAGCDYTSNTVQSGFLSSYDNLNAISPTEMTYMAPNFPLENYNKIIIDPVVTEMYSPNDAGDLDPKDKEHLTQYFYEALSKAISTTSTYKIATEPGPGVLRLRVGLTNLKKSSPGMNVLPQTKLSGVGLGQASVEAELLDSVTGKQIAAIIQSESGNRFSFAGLSKWGDVESVMNDWAERLHNRLESVRAPAPAPQ